ncbi:MAG: redoxin domain-containing protein [SAR202 cluster bacterium]|nr:redoxin domain-containing protein [SAR202 cluster bacterium]
MRQIIGNLVLIIMIVAMFACSENIADHAIPNSQLAPKPNPIEFDTPGPWINSEPFVLKDKRNEVVLIDFWTYSCVNCIRTLPHLSEWHRKYNEKGLNILGVHSPEFEFEKIYGNVVSAAEDLGIDYPIVLDNDFKIWNTFSNRYWPAKYLLDKDGVIQFKHFGEGGYEETELAIRALLEEAGFDPSDIPTGLNLQQSSDSSNISHSEQTLELYMGTDRNYKFNFFQPTYIGNTEYYDNIRTDAWKKKDIFKSPPNRKKDKVYIEGLWSKEQEYISHSRDTDAYNDYVFLKFSGAEVNVVLGKHNNPYKVLATLDGSPLLESEAGKDIYFDPDGKSFIEVDSSRMYNIVKLKKFDTRELILSSTSSEFSIYSFTFGSDVRE